MRSDKLAKLARRHTVLASTYLRMRRLAGRGGLPHFLVLGAQKAGTTSLFKYLSRHPGLARPFRKEVHFFDQAYDRGLGWYRAHFPAERDPRLRYEATPYYLYHPLVPHRARRHLPDARLIVLLRDPVARAYSHYWHEVENGREARPFALAIEGELERMAADEEALIRGTLEHSDGHQRHSYLSRGFYTPQIERWLACYPREQFLFVASRELFGDPDAALGRILSFVGADPSFSLREKDNRAHNSRSYPRLEPALRERLEALFDDDRAAVGRLTGIEL
ncbi:sulfotransferase [Geminicoccaceae bacterium 1502E]|nr:sulfotransferase [Geminicoccaceae bacterium 1502E]